MPAVFKKTVLALLAAALAATAFWVLRSPKPFDGPVGTLGLDLSRPDALLQTRSLARLPADLLRIPLARDVLTETFLDYYETHDHRLALSGTLRRLAFEHRLSLPEQVLASVFDEPAELAFWRGHDGTLKHFALAMTRNALARTLQTLLPLAGDDLQLSHAGSLQGSELPLLILRYGYRHRLLLVARGDRVVVLSDPGMLLATPPDDAPAAAPVPQDARAVAVLTALLEPDTAPSPFARRFALGEQTQGAVHRLVLGSAFFSLHYNAFAPGLEALSLAFDDRGHWQTALLTDGDRLPAGALNGTRLWPLMPHGASLCALVPVDWSALAPLAGRLLPTLDASASTALGELFEGPAAVCWYPQSRLFAPLFAAALRRPPDPDQLARLAALFGQAVGPAGALPETQRSPDGETHLWQKPLDSRFALHAGGETRSLAPSLGVTGQTLAFSPDPALVERLLDVAAKRYPAQADTLPAAERTLLSLNPQALSDQLRREALIALPADREALLRNAAEAHLLPRLAALGQHPPHLLLRPSQPPAQGLHWTPLSWESRQP